MVDYIGMLRSGLCEYAIQQTVPNPYAGVTVRLIRALAKCLADSFREDELDKLEVVPVLRHESPPYFGLLRTVIANS